MVDFSGRHVHLIGIGGAGMSAIARVLLEQGAMVSGSDLVVSPVARSLADDGATVFEGHAETNVEGADVVVMSSAVPDDNVEVEAARAAGIPVVGRPAFLGQMMSEKQGIAVAGTHGKTTTTAMVATILLAAGRDPTFVVGGVLTDLETNARAGSGPLFVVEADEYDCTFLNLKPDVAVITNVEHDHPDCYPTFSDFCSAFESFAALVPDSGVLVVCADDPVARAIGESRTDGPSVRFFGLAEGAEWRAEEIQTNFAGGVDFLAVRGDETLGLVRLRVPGSHNASNAMAALALTDHLGVPFGVARDALMGFRGVARRFQVMGEAGDVVVIDDYAHHPTEIQATLRAARERYPERRIWAVWQPHTYSRTKELLEGFAGSFGDADRVIVLPVYPARETDTLGVTAADVVRLMGRGDARVAASAEEAAEWLRSTVRPGDAVLTLGAGDGNQVGRYLLADLGGQADAERR